MAAINLQLNLRDELAQKLTERGLLRPHEIEKLLEIEFLRRKEDRSLSEHLRLVQLIAPAPMSDQELDEEIQAARRERRERETHRS